MYPAFRLRDNHSISIYHMLDMTQGECASQIELSLY